MKAIRGTMEKKAPDDGDGDDDDFNHSVFKTPTMSWL